MQEESTALILADVEHIRSKVLYAAYGWLPVSGAVHLRLHLVAQYLQDKRAPEPEATLFYDLNTARALGQAPTGYLRCWSFVAEAFASGHWPELALGFKAADGWSAGMSLSSNLFNLAVLPWFSLYCPVCPHLLPKELI